MTPFEFLNLSLAFWIVATILGVISLVALLVVLVLTAKRLGRSEIGWFFIGFFCSPLIASLMLLLLELTSPHMPAKAADATPSSSATGK